MRRSRQLRPDGLTALEDRVVLSGVAPHPHVHKPVAAVNASTPTPDNVVKGNVGNFHGRSIAQTLQAGDPVYEQITTRYSDGTTRKESKLITPDKSTNTVTTISNINLRNGAGRQRIVDVAVTTGATVNHTLTITLPGGGVETGTEVEITQGGKTYLKGSTTLPGGSVKTFIGTVTGGAGKATTDETITDPEGFTTHFVSTVDVHNELSQSSTSTTTHPDGTSSTSNSNTFILRLEPPSS